MGRSQVGRRFEPVRGNESECKTAPDRQANKTRQLSHCFWGCFKIIFPVRLMVKIGRVTTPTAATARRWQRQGIFFHHFWPPLTFHHSQTAMESNPPPALLGRLPLQRCYSLQQAVFHDITLWAATRGFKFMTRRLTVGKSGQLISTYSCSQFRSGCQFSILERDIGGHGRAVSVEWVLHVNASQTNILTGGGWRNCTNGRPGMTSVMELSVPGMRLNPVMVTKEVTTAPYERDGVARRPQWTRHSWIIHLHWLGTGRRLHKA